MSLTSRLENNLRAVLRKYRAVLAGCLLSGLAAHGFMMANKLINHDELNGLFGTGAQLSSGRWGKELVSYIFPTYSMPWLWGLIAIGMVSIAACMIVRMFAIQSKTLQFLCGGIIVAFPSETGMLLFTYTVPGVSIAFLFAVWAALLFADGRICNRLFALILLVFSLSMYQAYVALTASLLVLKLMQEAMRVEKRTAQILYDGLRSVLFLALSMAIYFGITKLLMGVQGEEFSSYTEERVLGAGEMLRGLPRNMVNAYLSFVRCTFGRAHGLVQTKVAVVVHLICGALSLGLILASLGDCRKRGGVRRCALLLFLLAILPLAIESLYLIAPSGIHALTQYSFIAVYVLAAMLVDERLPERRRVAVARDAVAVSLAIVLCTNIYVANRAYLRMYMEYENTYALCQSVATQIEMTPGFEEGDRIALIGSVEDSDYLEKFKGAEIAGVGSYRNAYSRNKFFTYYLGMNFHFASEDEIEALKRDSRVRTMNCYPYYGSVQKIDGFIVVKLGED